MTLFNLAKRLRSPTGRAPSEKPVRHWQKKERRLQVEGLEPRLLLYAANGGVWPHPELVTVSFMPDGTDIGGMPSSLFSSMNARFATATWQKEMLKGAQSYAANANINFSVASDDGSAFGSCGGSGTDCNMQGDSNFGDIRLGGFNLGSPLGIAMLPPPVNGDTTAGDFFLNTTASWNIGASFDLNTVSAHEAGHSVGLDHSAVTTAVMYEFYNGVKSSLTSDDIAGIQSIYGARTQDSFDAASPNNVKADASVITSYIDSNKQVTLTGLDLTSNSDDDWYKITTPSGNSGTMVVKVQSSGLSLLAPKLTLYKGSTLKGTVTGDYNSTISLSQSISNGQNWFIKVEGADATVFGTGKYALQINMGSGTLPPVNSPNTATAATGGGGFSSPDVVTEQDGLEASVIQVPTDSECSVTGSTHDQGSSDAQGSKDNQQDTSVLIASVKNPVAPAATEPESGGNETGHSHHTSAAVDELLVAGLLDAVLADF